MRRLALVAAALLLLVGCASLPPTNLPVCAERFEATCRAPVRCVLDEKNTFCGCKKTTEVWWDELWERGRVCPAAMLVEGHPDLRACYTHRGVMDSRTVYEYRVFSIRSGENAEQKTSGTLAAKEN